MQYQNITEGIFVSRPNRFVAQILINGKEETVHVKNTGRCRELLVPGARVFLEKSNNPNRKTLFDLIAVYKGDLLINMDSQAPNNVFAEWAEQHFCNLTFLRPEVTHGDSRFDFYLEADGKQIFVEVKGVTLEENGVVSFPDAPTKRGVKHLNGLVRCVQEGFRAMAVFVVQMEHASYFQANAKTHPAFEKALQFAVENGVEILAITCKVTPDSIVPFTSVPVKI